MGLPLSQKGNDAVLVIVDQLTKSSNFLPMQMTHSINKLAQLYVDVIVRLRGVPVTVVSYQDPRFTSTFWKSLHKALGTKLNFSLPFMLRLSVS